VIQPNVVKNLANEIRKESEAVVDPRLNDLLSEIETRAEVELAKIEMSQKNRNN